jgi:hypothetical protein
MSFLNFDASLFLLPLDENLICGVCLGILNNPLQCPNGHNFCKACIETYLKDSRKPCPMRCSAVLYSTDGLIKNRALVGIIDNLVIRCPTTTLLCVGGGCAWTGTIAAWKGHAKTCPFEMITCEFEGCNETLQRKNMPHHKAKCLFREESCMWCNKIFSHRQLLLHCCAYEVIPCPHACCDSMGNEMQCLQRDMNNHLLLNCPEEVISCSFRSLGCNMRLPRKEMTHHQQDTDCNNHLSMLVNKLLQQDKQLAKQQQTIAELSSLAFTEIIFSIQHFDHSQAYASPTIDFFGRSFQVSFASDMSYRSCHNIVLHCTCDMPTHIKSLTASLHQQQHSSNQTTTPASTMLSPLLLVAEKTVCDVYFSPSSPLVAEERRNENKHEHEHEEVELTTLLAAGGTSVQRKRPRLQSTSSLASSSLPSWCGKWEMDKFIRTDSLLSCISPERSIIISVKLSLLR